jgi:hypothetical protein
MSDINHRGLGQGVSPLASNPNPSPSNLDQDDIMDNDDDTNEVAGCDETDRRMMGIVNNESQTLQSHRDTVEARYAENYNTAARVLQKAPTTFQALKEDQNRLGKEPWAPFKSKNDWELAAFLIKDVSQTATDKFLKLPIVSEQDL